MPGGLKADCHLTYLMTIWRSFCSKFYFVLSLKHFVLLKKTSFFFSSLETWLSTNSGNTWQIKGKDRTYSARGEFWHAQALLTDAAFLAPAWHSVKAEPVACGQETTLKIYVGCSQWGFGSSVTAEFCEVRPGLPCATHSCFRAQLGPAAGQCAWGQNTAQHWGARVRVWGTAPGTTRPEKEEETHWCRHWSRAFPAACVGPAGSWL